MAVEPIRSQSIPARDTPRALSHGNAIEYAKERIPPLLMERLDLALAVQLPPEEVSQQLGEIITELLAEEQIQLNGPEHDQVVRHVVGDFMDRRAEIQNKKVESGATEPWMSLGKGSDS